MEEYAEARILARFEKYDEFVKLQRSILQFDLNRDLTEEERRNDAVARGALFRILAEYQEQSYLLDPFLEELVSPVVDQLKEHASALALDKPDSKRASALSRISLILYHYIKCRGYKTIIRFFPHEIADLSVALNFLRHLNELEGSLIWSLQYVVFLWISLICMIPFDFSQFDEPGRLGETAASIEAEAKKCLGKSGLEREGAALALSRFYVRKDTTSRFPGFLAWCNDLIARAEHNIFESIGALQTLCEIMKTAPIEIAMAHVPSMLALGRLIESNKLLMTNAIVRKLKIKLVSRAALRLLPTTSISNRRRGRVLTTTGHEQSHPPLSEEDADVPEEIESVLEDLFPGLQDRDTIVRWASAKAIARISERLPPEFIDQVVDTAINLFTIHSIGVASLYDMPAIAESTWQGACLVCAELARRGLVPNESLGTLTDWMIKALLFDIRKGAHSIGSSVRDSAAYVLWSLARSYSPSVLEPFSEVLAKKLVVVSVYDREVHIRRAASATFQEYVGRTSLFPHGIDVLRKTDFFMVGVRRNAFLTAAVQTAEHEFYRPYLIDHLLNVTLRHWDSSMRQLGAQSLREICKQELPTLGPECSRRIRPLLSTSDFSDIHGALLAMTELAAEFRQTNLDHHNLEEHRKALFTFLADVPFDTIQSPRQELITAAACHLIAQSITVHEIQLENGSSVPHWRKIVDIGLKHRAVLVQEAASSAMGQISKLVDCSAVLQRSIRDFQQGLPGVQQSLARLIGALDYTAHDHGLKDAIACLLRSVNKTSPKRMSNVEARRNFYASITQILGCVVGKIQSLLAPSEIHSLFDALISGLEDYSVDERGDVGSWVRITCVQGLSRFTAIMFRNAHHIANFAEYFPPEKYHAAMSGILKQGIERLDNVRQQAGEQVVALLNEPLPSVPNAEAWRIHGEGLLKSLFIGDNMETWGWQDSSWLFPRAMRLLEVKEYWLDVMAGLLLSISSKTDSTQRPVANSLIAYVQKLPVVAVDGTIDQRKFAGYLISRAKSNLGSNNNVLPVLQMFNVLLEAEALTPLASDAEGLKSLQALLSITTRGASRLKSVHRIHESMKTAVNLLSVPQLYATCVPCFADFLTHEYPRVRGDTAEHLYLTLQTRDLDRDTDEAEELLAETEWMSDDLETVRAASQQVIQLLL